MKRLAYKWEVILLLWLAFFLNQGDRQVFNVVIPLLEKDLNFSDVQVGLIATIFTLVYGFLVPFAGYVGDVFSKSKVVMLSLLIFSLGTTLTGLASGLLLIIIFRSIATGAGEAFYYPAANSLIGEYHKNTRAQAMGIHQTALYSGVIISGFLAGYLGERFGWRVPFIVYGMIGVLWTILLFFRLKDKSKKEVRAEISLPLNEVVRYIKKKQIVLWLSFAFGSFQFAMVGYLTWMPTFLHEKFDLSLSNAGFSSVFYFSMLAILGVLVGGRLSDRLSEKRPKIRMETEYWGVILGAPFLFIIGLTDSLIIVYLSLIFLGFFRGVYDSNLFAALFDFIEPKYRSSATGLMLSIGFIISSISPVLLGWIKQNFSLSFGFSLLGFAFIISAVILILASKFLFQKNFVRAGKLSDS